MDFAKLKVSDRVCIANLQHLGVQLERQKKVFCCIVACL